MDEIPIDPLAPPDLRGTICLVGEVEGRRVSTWSELVRACVEIAIERGMSTEEVRDLSTLNIIGASMRERGFVPLTHTGPSVQYADANRCWVGARNLAAELGLAIQIKFRWKESANSPTAGRWAGIKLESTRTN